MPNADQTPPPCSDIKPSRLAVAAGVAVGLSLMGDSLLYNLLPLEATQLGIPLALVGILLSANRLIRLASNTWISQLFERAGPHIPFALATVLALITTAMYGLGWGFLVFLVARIGWGIAWSALRHGGYQAVWAGNETNRGRLMGIFWGAVRVGSGVSVLLGGLLYDRFSYQVAFAAIACGTALALPAALAIRWPRDTFSPLETPTDSRGWSGGIKNPRQRWLLAAGFLHSAFEGVFTSTLSLFIAGRLGAGTLSWLPGMGAATVTGFMLAVRWLSGLFFGPFFGALSDRLGRARLILTLAAVQCGVMVAVVVLPASFSIPALALILILGAGLYVTLSATANNVAARSTRPHWFVGLYTTAADAGLAIGPLLAYLGGELVGFTPIYLLGVALLLGALVRYRQLDRRES